MDTTIETTQHTRPPLAKREFVYDTNLNYGTVIHVAESELSKTSACGYGALVLESILEDVPHGLRKTFAGVHDMERMSMVYFRGTSLGKAKANLVKLVQLPLYFSEVKAFTPISPEDMSMRESFAKLTGYVITGPDECLAILTQVDTGYTFCDVFENNDLGVLRSKAGVFADTVEHHANVKQIADLHKTSAERSLAEARGDLMWWYPQTEIISPTQLDRMKKTVELLLEHIPHAPPERTESGATITRSFIENGSTESTLPMRPYANGWRRYPTHQDAWYFGCWVNPVTMETLTYAEQDVSHVVCENRIQFDAEMKAMASFYGKHPSPSMIGFGESESWASFDTLTFLEGQAVEICFNSGAPAKDENGHWVAPLAGTLKVDHPLVLGLEDGQSLTVERDCFELNLLDPRSFEKSYVTTLTKGDGKIKITVQFDENETHTASV